MIALRYTKKKNLKHFKITAKLFNSSLLLKLSEIHPTLQVCRKLRHFMLSQIMSLHEVYNPQVNPFRSSSLSSF